MLLAVGPLVPGREAVRDADREVVPTERSHPEASRPGPDQRSRRRCADQTTVTADHLASRPERRGRGRGAGRSRHRGASASRVHVVLIRPSMRVVGEVRRPSGRAARLQRVLVEASDRLVPPAVPVLEEHQRVGRRPGRSSRDVPRVEHVRVVRHAPITEERAHPGREATDSDTAPAATRSSSAVADRHRILVVDHDPPAVVTAYRPAPSAGSHRYSSSVRPWSRGHRWKSQ